MVFMGEGGERGETGGRKGGERGEKGGGEREKI